MGSEAPSLAEYLGSLRVCSSATSLGTLATSEDLPWVSGLECYSLRLGRYWASSSGVVKTPGIVSEYRDSWGLTGACCWRGVSAAAAAGYL
jgi:hypothetical protein